MDNKVKTKVVDDAMVVTVPDFTQEKLKELMQICRLLNYVFEEVLYVVIFEAVDGVFTEAKIQNIKPLMSKSGDDLDHYITF